MIEEKKELQEKYIQLQLIDNQINQIQKQIQILDNQLIELELVNKSLDDFGKIKTGTEILIPLTSSIYAKAELKNNEDLIINIGSNVVIKKKIPATQKIINNQLSEVKKIKEQMMMDIKKLILKASSIEKEINSIIPEKK